jgi:hypothetical protein
MADWYGANTRTTTTWCTKQCRRTLSRCAGNSLRGVASFANFLHIIIVVVVVVVVTSSFGNDTWCGVAHCAAIGARSTSL